MKSRGKRTVLRNDNVKRTIETLGLKRVITLPQIEEVQKHLGQTIPEYQLLKKTSVSAAIRAGYSEKTAGQIGEQNLKKLEIQALLTERMKAREQRAEITQDKVLACW